MNHSTRIARYLQHKPAWPEQLLLLRAGDLYEAFDADAQAIARCLNDATALAEGRPWWCCSAEDLEPCQKRLLRAGFRVAVGDTDEEGEVDILESGDLPTDRPAAAARLEWPARPVKGESPEGYLLDTWESACGELRVRRVEPLSGPDPGWFVAEALAAGDEDAWLELGRASALAAALKLALAHYRGTAPERRQAAADWAELLSLARQRGLADFSAPSVEEDLPETEEIPVAFSPEQGRIVDGQGDADTHEQEMNMSAALAGRQATTPDLVMSEEDARELAGELGWKMDLKDAPLTKVLKDLNGIFRETSIEDLEKPKSPSCRAWAKQVFKTLQAGGRVTVAEGVVEEKSKRRATTRTESSTPKTREGKARGDGRFTGCSAYLAKLVRDGVRGDQLVEKVRKKFPGAGISWTRKREERLLAKQQAGE